MAHIILDSNIIINYPEVLSYAQEGTKLIVPDLVLEEILNFQSTGGRQLGSLLQDAQKQGTIVFTATPRPNEKLQGSVLVSYTDFMVAGYAKYLQEQGNDVVLATEDKKLVAFAGANAIRTYDTAALITHFARNSRQVQSIQKQADRIESKARWSYLINILITVLLLVLLVWLIRNYGDLVDKLAKPFLVVLLIVLGFVLFEVRQKRRQLYGFFELGFGILTIVVCMYPSIILENWDAYLTIIAGLYVIVRGLDNIHIGSEGKSLGSIFKKMFRL